MADATPRNYRCPAGHAWSGADELAPDGMSAALCPVCNADGGAEAKLEPKAVADATLGYVSSASVDSSAAAPRPSFPPHYEYLGELGRGGMGVVYKARQKGLNRTVALKMILAGSHAGQTALGRFQFEAQALARLQHPHIVQIYEVSEHDGLPFFSLEFLEGGSLAEQLDGTPWSSRRAAEVILELAEAIQAAHDRQVVHRDLKPANVLLSGAGVLKITDFGLAKALDSVFEQTHTGAILGTPSYMAPEQASGNSNAIGPLSDVYALGAMLYELLTGRAPFRASTPLDTVLQVISAEPIPPTHLHPKISRDVETICLKCLAKEPGQRYESAAALAADLTRFVNGQPIVARPISAFERGAKWVRRRPALAAMLFFSCLIAAGSFVVVTREWRVAAGALSETQTELYYNQIALAHREWLANRPQQAIELLAASPPGLRGWEWHYLKSLTSGALISTNVNAIHYHNWLFTPTAVTRDGSRFAISDARGRVTIRRFPDGVVEQTLRVGDGSVIALAFDQSGQLLATTTAPAETAQSRLVVWEWAKEKERFRIDDVDASVVTFSTRDPLLAFAGGDPLSQSTAKISNVNSATGEPVVSWNGLPGLVPSLAFSRDGKLLAAGQVLYTATSGKVSLFDVSKDTPLAPLEGHQRGVTGVDFSPDGQSLATASMDRTAGVWNLSDRREIVRYRGHTAALSIIHFTDDGEFLLTGSFDSAVHLWRSKDAEFKRSFPGAIGAVTAATINVTGQSIAITSSNLAPTPEGHFQVWDVSQDQSATVNAHNGAIVSLAVSPSGQRIATASFDGTVRVADAASLKSLSMLRGPGGRPNAVCFASSDDKIIALDGGGHVTVRTLDGSVLQSLPNQVVGLSGIALSRHGEYLLLNYGLQPFAAEDGIIEVWDLRTLQRLLQTRGRCGAFNPVRDSLLIGGNEVIEELSLPSGTPTRTLTHDNKLRTALSLTADGRQLAVGRFDGAIEVWDLEQGKLRFTAKGHNEPIWSVAFHPDGTRVATASLSTGGAKGKTVLWDVPHGREAFSFEGSAFVAFANQGTELISTVPDVFAGALRTWRILPPFRQY